MVSGFLTSPLDQDRMASGEATEMATYSTWLTLSSPNISRALSLVLLIILFWLCGERVAKFFNRLREVHQGIGSGGLIQRVGVTHFHIETQRLHFFDQHVEGFGHTRFQAVIAFDNALIDARAALHVVGLDGKQFL